MESGVVNNPEKYQGIWWTEDRIARVTELCAEGLSYRHISEIMGAKSRNSISGIVSRLGLKPKKQKVANAAPKKRIRRKLTEAEKIIRRKPKLMSEIIKGDEILPLLDSIAEVTLENCAYPYGDHEFKFCGRPREHGSYCLEHGALCYQTWKPSKSNRPFFRIRVR